MLYAILGAAAAYGAQKFFTTLDFPVSLLGDFLKLLTAVAVGDLLTRQRRNLLYLLVPVFPVTLISELYQQHRVVLPDDWATAIENPTAYVMVMILFLLLSLLVAGNVTNYALRRDAIPVRNLLTATLLLFGAGIAILPQPLFFAQLHWMDVGFTAYVAAVIGRKPPAGI